MTPAVAPGDSPVSLATPSREATLLDIGIILLQRWRLMLGLPFAVAALTAAVSLLMRPIYTASTSFVPEPVAGSQVPASLAGLAGQFGLSLGTDASRSPRFYADVLKSREILERTLQSRYVDPRASKPGDSTRLINILDVRGRSSADSVSNGVRALRNLVSTQVDNQTNIVRLSVNSRYAAIAAAVANRMIDYLNAFNAQSRQSQARERRRFVEQRISEAEAELRSAEGDLRAFYERNRTWQQAPQLVFEEGRIRRQLEIRQEVYLTLKREFETARIEEVNDTPVITVIDAAATPQRRSRPRRTLMVMLGFVLGAILAAFGAFGADFVERARREDGGLYQDFTAALAAARRDLARLFRTVLSRRPGGRLP